MNDIYWTTIGDLGALWVGLGVMVVCLAIIIAYDWLEQHFPGWWVTAYRWLKWRVVLRDCYRCGWCGRWAKLYGRDVGRHERCRVPW